MARSSHHFVNIFMNDTVITSAFHNFYRNGDDNSPFLTPGNWNWIVFASGIRTSTDIQGKVKRILHRGIQRFSNNVSVALFGNNEVEFVRDTDGNFTNASQRLDELLIQHVNLPQRVFFGKENVRALTVCVFDCVDEPVFQNVFLLKMLQNVTECGDSGGTGISAHVQSVCNLIRLNHDTHDRLGRFYTLINPLDEGVKPDSFLRPDQLDILAAFDFCNCRTLVSVTVMSNNTLKCSTDKQNGLSRYIAHDVARCSPMNSPLYKKASSYLSSEHGSSTSDNLLQTFFTPPVDV
jgi:hypothetical protein